MFENLGWGELLVLLVAGLFILGPERLPEAAAWLARSIRQVKDMVSGARDQMRSEMGSDFDEFRKPFDDLREPLEELRSLRSYDPRRAVTRSLFSDDTPSRPSGNGSSGAGGAGVAGSSGNGSIRPAMHPGAEPPRRLAAGERPPIDPDAT